MTRIARFNGFDGSRDHQLAAGISALGTEIDHPVGARDHIQMVLDDHQRVTLLDQRFEGIEQLCNVVEVQACGGLVEQERHRLVCVSAFALGRLGQMTGQFQALRLAAAQGRHRLAQTQIVESDLGEWGEHALHMTDVGEVVQRFMDCHVQHIGHGHRAGAARWIDTDFQGFGTVASAIAIGAAEINITQELHLDVLEAVATTGRTTAGA